MSPLARLMFGAGDYVAGALIGAATAASVWLVVGPEVDLALAMVAGTALGMVVHVILGVALSPLVGFFHVMVPASLIGMWGGMLFAMRDAMHPVSLTHSIAVGLIFGAIVAGGVRFYDRALASPSGAPQEGV